MNIKATFKPCLATAILLCAAAAHSSALDIVIYTPVVWSDAGGNNIIRLTSPGQAVVNNWGCSDPDSYMVRSTLEKATQARIYATLLTAKAMGKPVTLRVSGCESSRPAILAVYF